MIRVCAGYERENGEKVHRRIRILGMKRPFLKLVRTDGICPECLAAQREDARRRHREDVGALKARRIVEKYKERAGVPADRQTPTGRLSVAERPAAGTPAQN